jgi:hypothetical protein
MKMSIYEEVLKSVSETKTLAQHITRLGKLKIDTEDTKLMQLLENFVNRLQRLHASSKTKSTPITLDQISRAVALDLLKYCAEHKKSKKPEWEILAERHVLIPVKVVQ